MTTSTTVLLGPSPTPAPTFSDPAGPGLPGPSQWLTDTATAAVGWCAHRPWLAGVAIAALIAAHAGRTVIARLT